MIDKLEQEGDYWIVYRYSDNWGKCPIIRTKDKQHALKIIDKL